MQAPHIRDSSGKSNLLRRGEISSRGAKGSRGSVCKQRRRARFTQQRRDGDQSAAAAARLHAADFSHSSIGTIFHS